MLADPLDVIQVSAKEGVNVDQILEAIVTRPAAKDADDVPLRALIFDRIRTPTKV